MPRSTPAAPKAERQKKTPEERATEALGTAQRVRAKVQNKLAEARQTVSELEAEEKKATARLAYVGIHPDLSEEQRQHVAAILAPEPDAEAPDA